LQIADVFNIGRAIHGTLLVCGGLSGCNDIIAQVIHDFKGHVIEYFPG